MNSQEKIIGFEPNFLESVSSTGPWLDQRNSQFRPVLVGVRFDKLRSGWSKKRLTNRDQRSYSNAFCEEDHCSKSILETPLFANRKGFRCCSFKSVMKFIYKSGVSNFKS